MPLLPDLWGSALGGILDLVLVGCQLSVYIWLLLLALAGHVLVGYGLVSLGDFLQGTAVCGDHSAEWHSAGAEVAV